MGFTGFYWVLPSFTGCHGVLVGCASFEAGLSRFYRVFVAWPSIERCVNREMSSAVVAVATAVRVLSATG